MRIFEHGVNHEWPCPRWTSLTNRSHDGVTPLWASIHIAGGFAALMLATAAFVLGGDAWEGISAITRPSEVSQ